MLLRLVAGTFWGFKYIPEFKVGPPYSARTATKFIGDPKNVLQAHLLRLGVLRFQAHEQLFRILIKQG